MEMKRQSRSEMKRIELNGYEKTERNRSVAKRIELKGRDRIEPK